MIFFWSNSTITHKHTHTHVHTHLEAQIRWRCRPQTWFPSRQTLRSQSWQPRKRRTKPRRWYWESAQMWIRPTWSTSSVPNTGWTPTVPHMWMSLYNTHCNTTQNVLQHIQYAVTQPTYRVYALCATNSIESAQCIASHFYILQHNATNCHPLQQTATNFNLRVVNVAKHRAEQHTATHCNTLQHTATTL